MVMLPPFSAQNAELDKAVLYRVSSLLLVSSFLREPSRNVTLLKVSIGNNEVKFSMYADDTTVFVRDTDSIIHLLNLLQQFKVCSGLEINTSKTEAVWLGCWKNRPDTPFGFKWPQKPICALGVFFSNDTSKANELNFKNRICGLERILNIRKCRKPTL